MDVPLPPALDSVYLPWRTESRHYAIYLGIHTRHIRSMWRNTILLHHFERDKQKVQDNEQGVGISWKILIDTNLYAEHRDILFPHARDNARTAIPLHVRHRRKGLVVRSLHVCLHKSSIPKKNIRSKIKTYGYSHTLFTTPNMAVSC